MQTVDGNLFTRSDTFFGVCEGLAEDTRIPANLLRLVFAGLLFWNPVAAICGYLGLGLVIAAARWFFPPARKAEAAPDAAPEPVAAEAERLPLAA